MNVSSTYQAVSRDVAHARECPPVQKCTRSRTREELKSRHQGQHNMPICRDLDKPSADANLRPLLTIERRDGTPGQGRKPRHESPAKRIARRRVTARARRCPSCVPSVFPRPRTASSSPVRRVARNPPNLDARRVRLTALRTRASLWEHSPRAWMKRRWSGTVPSGAAIVEPAGLCSGTVAIVAPDVQRRAARVSLQVRRGSAGRIVAIPSSSTSTT